MPEARFWQLMTHIDRPLLLSGQDDEPGALRAALTQLPADDIIAFALRLADRLAALLTASRARTGPFGDDGLLYAACHAVARGQAWFEASMRWPAMFDDADADPDTSWCESLLYLPREAWSQATGAGEDDFRSGRWRKVWRRSPATARVHRRRRRAPPRHVADRLHRLRQLRAASRHRPPRGAGGKRPRHAGRAVGRLLWCLLDLDDYLGIVNEQGRASRSCMTPARTCTGPKCRARPTRPPMARNSRAKPCWTCCTGCP